MNHTIDQRELAGLFILIRNAFTNAMRIGSQLSNFADSLYAAAFQNVHLAERFGQHGNGVYASIRRSCMTRTAMRRNARSAFAGFKGDTLFQFIIQLFQRCTYFGFLNRNRTLGQIRNHVAHGACIQLDQIARTRNGKVCIHRALLTVVHRERCIRHQRELRECNAIFRQIFHVLHAGFFTAAAQKAQAVLELPAKFPEHAHGKQRGNGCAFVIAHTAANQHIMLRHIGCAIRRINPSIAHRHHIQMGDHADGIHRIPHRNRNSVAIVILHVKAIMSSAFHHVIQHAAAIRAKRGAGLRFVRTAYGRDAGNALHLADVFFFMFRNPNRCFFQQFLIGLSHYNPPTEFSLLYR